MVFGTLTLQLFLALFYPPGTEVVEVSLSAEQYQVFEETYTTELEQGYCLFGHIHNGEVVVERVIHTDYPIPWTNTGSQIHFTCIPELIEQLPRIAVDSEYRFVGAAHSHPQTPYLSHPDRFWFRTTGVFQRIHGIYNGNLQFYTLGSMDDPVNTEFSTKTGSGGDAA